MTISCNKNITKQLNSYSYVIVITLQGLLQRTKRAIDVLLCMWMTTKKINLDIVSFSLFFILHLYFLYFITKGY